MYKRFIDRREEGKTILEKVQIVQLRMLKIFDDICTKHNINYFLMGGTLLGAIRHKGFIPWDDDIDVMMIREDFEKFAKIAQKELPDDLFWQDINTDNFPFFRMLLAKIRDKNSQMEKNDNYHTGVFLDIFVLEKASVNEKKAKKQKRYLNLLCHLDLLKNYKSFMQQIRVKQLSDKSIFIKKGLTFFVFCTQTFLKYFDIPTVLRNIYYKSVNKEDYIIYWYTGGNYLDFSKDDIFPLKRVVFEDTKVNILNNYDKLLRYSLGDYMTLPPIQTRKPGHIMLDETLI